MPERYREGVEVHVDPETSSPRAGEIGTVDRVDGINVFVRFEDGSVLPHCDGELSVVVTDGGLSRPGPRRRPALEGVDEQEGGDVRHYQCPICDRRFRTEAEQRPQRCPWTALHGGGSA